MVEQQLIAAAASIGLYSSRKERRKRELSAGKTSSKAADCVIADKKDA